MSASNNTFQVVGCGEVDAVPRDQLREHGLMNLYYILDYQMVIIINSLQVEEETS